VCGDPGALPLLQQLVQECGDTLEVMDEVVRECVCVYLIVCVLAHLFVRVCVCVCSRFDMVVDEECGDTLEVRAVIESVYVSLCCLFVCMVACMCLCVCMRLCVCARVSLLFVCMHGCVYVLVCVCACVCACVSLLFVGEHGFVYVLVCVCVCVCVCVRERECFDLCGDVCRQWRHAGGEYL